MLSEYFLLQIRMLNRRLTSLGIYPALGYLSGSVLFYLLTQFLFSLSSMAGYLVLFFAVGLIAKLSDIRRSDFLKGSFSSTDYFAVRFIENMVVMLPFLIMLLLNRSWIPALLLTVSGWLLVVMKFGGRFHFVLPTPFYRRPFEFTVGFRVAFYLFFISYFLMVMAIKAVNFNLGVFSMLLIFLTCISFYAHPENEFYVWIYALTPKEFLLEKVRIALIFSTLLCLPVTVALLVFFSGDIPVAIGIQLLCYLFLIVIILAKYSAFPGQISLPQLLVIALRVWFPLLLIGVIPYFYSRSVKRLNDYLL